MLGHLRKLIIDIGIGRVACDGDLPGRIKFVILPCRTCSHCRLASFPHHHIHEMVIRQADIGAELYLRLRQPTDIYRCCQNLEWAQGRRKQWLHKRDRQLVFRSQKTPGLHPFTFQSAAFCPKMHSVKTLTTCPRFLSVGTFSL